MVQQQVKSSFDEAGNTVKAQRSFEFVANKFDFNVFSPSFGRFEE